MFKKKRFKETYIIEGQCVKLAIKNHLRTFRASSKILQGILQQYRKSIGLLINLSAI